MKAILVSGDNGTRFYNETDGMRDYLIEKGVPAAKVVGDYAGFDTYDSCVRAKKVFGVSKAIVVSQTYHLPRALATCRAIGIEAWGVGDESVKTNQQMWSYGTFREFGANLKMVWDVLSQRQPTSAPAKRPWTTPCAPEEGSVVPGVTRDLTAGMTQPTVVPGLTRDLTTAERTDEIPASAGMTGLDGMTEIGRQWRSNVSGSGPTRWPMSRSFRACIAWSSNSKSKMFMFSASRSRDDAFGNTIRPALNVPAQDHLGRGAPQRDASALTAGASRSAVRPSGDQASVAMPRFCVERRPVRTAAGWGAPSIWLTAGTVALGDRPRQVLLVKVRHPDRAGQALRCLQLFQGVPGLDVGVELRRRPVDQVQVDVVEAELLQRLGERGGGIGLPVVPQLGGDEQLVARHAGLGDGLTDRLPHCRRWRRCRCAGSRVRGR